MPINSFSQTGNHAKTFLQINWLKEIVTVFGREIALYVCKILHAFSHLARFCYLWG
jgi:hypothetical protein